MDYFSSTLGYRVQKTLQKSLFFEGRALHSGRTTRVAIHPAPVNFGLVFERSDLLRPFRILARSSSVMATDMATTLGSRHCVEERIGTVEHLLAALFSMGITNALMEVKGPEIPILDGSAFPFVEKILEVGLKIQPYSTATLKILKPIRIFQQGAACELLPRDRLRITATIDFACASIGLQTFALDVTPRAFQFEIGKARTFGFLKDLEHLRASNLAQGASLENVLAFSDEGMLNPEGVRFADECVRHKVLDALGDLALCGCWIEGELVSYRGGHTIHLALLRSLETHRSHWEIIPADPLKGPFFDSALHWVQPEQRF